MRFCTEHADRMLGALQERGLAVLIAETDCEGIEKVRSAMEVGHTVDNFDPLLGAYGLIVRHALSIAGPHLVVPGGVMGCPLCRLNFLHGLSCPDPGECGGVPFDRWIGDAADHMVAAWKAMAS